MSIIAIMQIIGAVGIGLFGAIESRSLEPFQFFGALLAGKIEVLKPNINYKYYKYINYK